jgi:hypothetical protein
MLYLLTICSINLKAAGGSADANLFASIGY